MEDDGALNVTLLTDVRTAFRVDDVMRSVDLLAALVADPEAPWGGYNRGKPLTLRELAKLLGQFGVISTTVHPPGLSHGKGYKARICEPLWEAYCPPDPGHKALAELQEEQQACEGASAGEMGTINDFPSVREPPSARIEKPNLSVIHAALHVRTEKIAPGGEKKVMTKVDQGNETFPACAVLQEV